HTAMAACAGIAGSTRIGKYCSIGGAAMIAGHLVIADRVHVSSGSLVMHSIGEPGQFTGFYPVTKHANWEKSAVLVRNLPAMREKIRELEKTVRSLSKQFDLPPDSKQEAERDLQDPLPGTGAPHLKK
ncbi:MAG: UDP-3-O-(3-hydroxymyristoyl)glucosamine N-acyltransferase, partial [Janthinobacterium lividum]